MFCLAFLLASLLNVHSHPAPYLTLMGEILPNNSYVDFSLLGGDNSLQCHTNLTLCCASPNPHGDWIPPGSVSRVPFESNMRANVFEIRGNQQVDLHRRSTSGTAPSSGIYKCAIATVEGLDRATIFAGLYTSGGNITISDGIVWSAADHVLTCISTSGPAMNVTWTAISGTSDMGITTTILLDNVSYPQVTAINDTRTAQYIHNLTIPQMRLPGSTSYSCAVSNNKPSAAKAVVTLIGNDITNSMHISISSDTTNIEAGDSVTFTCSAMFQSANDVQDIPLYTWRGPAENGIGQDSSLTLSDITLSQAGNYSCTSTLDTSSITTVVNVVLQIPKPMVTITRSRTGPVCAGTNFSLTATIELNEVDINLRIKITWSRGNNIIGNSTLTTLSAVSGSEGVYTASLNYSPISTSDSGKIIATVIVSPVVNSIYVKSVTVSTTLLLSVQATPNPTVTISGPTTSSGITTAPAGTNLMLTCLVSVVDHLVTLPKSEWRGGSIGSDNVNTEGTPSSSLTLTFSPLHTSHGNVYTCEAEIKIESIGITKTTTEMRRIVIQIPVPMPHITSSRDTNIVEAGSSLILTCNYNLHSSVDTPIEEHVNWMVNGTAVNLMLSRISTGSDGQTLHVSPLATSDTGQYICELTVTVEEQDTFVTVEESAVPSSGKEITITIPEAVGSVVVQLSRTTGVYVGTSLTLTCTVTLHLSVDNNERVTTTWSSQQDLSGQRYTITPAMGSGQTYTSTLTISPLFQQNTGMYTCTATVQGGSNQRTATSNSAVNVLSLQNPVLSISTSAGPPTAGLFYALSCIVQTVPHLVVEPTITWHTQDSTQLESHSGSSLSLIFNPLRTSRGGQYTCRATVNIPGAISVMGEETKNIVVIIPPPQVEVTVTHTFPLYAGDSLILTCTVTLEPNVDNGENVMTVWSDETGIDEDRYLTAASGSGSTYTSTFTISPLAPQDAGKYTCTGTITGENGFEVTGSGNHYVDTIRIVRATVTDMRQSTSLALMWEILSTSETISTYTISFTNTNNTQCFKNSSVISEITGLHFTLRNLQEATEYNITVSAILSDGSTRNDYLIATTLAAVPSAPPISVTVSHVTASTITVQWGRVDCSHHNGHLTGYSVRYGVQGHQNTQTMNVSGVSIAETTISNLMVSTTYEIEVAAINSAGTGVFSPVVIATTQPNVYLSLNNIIIPNNSYVTVNAIGYSYSTALICHTNRPASGINYSGGNWYSPEGKQVSKYLRTVTVQGLVSSRAPMTVRLFRITTSSPPEGIYHCMIRDNVNTIHRIYVGIFDSVSEAGFVKIKNVTFTLNYNLSRDIPLFTLTCVSTGGPATNVTWTRDSNILTEPSSTVLNNAVEALYTHTLTVTGRRRGLYACTVINKISSSSTNITIQVANPPMDLSVYASEKTSTITIEWSMPRGGDDVTGYSVFYNHPSNITIVKENADATSATFIEGNVLQHVYSVSIQALSQHLPSIVVGPVTVRVPSPVQNVMVSREKQRKFNISWEEPEEPNDHTLNYTVTITDINTGRIELNKAVGEMDQLEVLSQPLAKGVPYNVTVFASNGKGNSSIVSMVVYAEEDVPKNPPSNIHVKRLNASHMMVSWTAPTLKEARGHITHYTVYYRLASNNLHVFSVTVTQDTTEVIISDLLPGETYVVEISASTSVGEGSKSMEVYSTLTQEHDTSVPIAIGAISAVILVAVAVAVIVVAVFFRKRICRESRRVKSKPIPMPRRLNYTGEEEPSHTGAEDVEMKDICADDEKDDYYFEDPSNIVTGRNDIHEDDFSDHVKQMHQERNHKFELEYKSLEKLTNAACDVACLSCNLTQNRFKNIYPYDHTRVELKKEPKVEGSDYINASFIDGYPDKKHVYIASQGPTEQSVERFWRMVWEYQLTTIVMLTRCVEDGKEKCAKYWPDQVHGTLNIGSKFIVTLTSIIPSAEYQIRKLQVNSVSDPNRDMTVTHMHYTAWPDHGVPQNAMSVISFIRRVRREHPHCLDQPLLVHCSAGVGRTGTFILLDTVMQQMKNEGTLSIYNVLKNVRDQRMKMVQTKAQYVFIHDALSELVVCGETDIPVASIRINISQLQKLIVGEAITGFQKQFKTMEQMSSQYQASYIEAEAEHNVEKNRFPDKLPNEASRVRLRYGTQPGSDYINASFIDGYKHRRAYIAAQGPLQNTVNDFWRMVWEHHCSCIVLLCDTEENNMDGCHCFWPNGLGGANMDGAEEVYGKMTVTLKRQSFYGDIIEWKLEVTENDGKGSTSQRMVTLLKLTSWPIDELPHPSSILSLIDLLGKAQRSSPSRHTVIMCSDGVGRTGSFICIHSQLERLKTEGVVDFFQGAKSARIQRAGLIPDDVHYAFCHEVVASYVDSFETYANFKEVV